MQELKKKKGKVCVREWLLCCLSSSTRSSAAAIAAVTRTASGSCSGAPLCYACMRNGSKMKGHASSDLHVISFESKLLLSCAISGL